MRNLTEKQKAFIREHANMESYCAIRLTPEEVEKFVTMQVTEEDFEDLSSALRSVKAANRYYMDPREPGYRDVVRSGFNQFTKIAKRTLGGK